MGGGGSTLQGNYSLRTFPPLPHADGHPIPNLDGGEGSSEQIIFGTSLDLEEVIESTQKEHAQETYHQSKL